jgi:hypothetical protein
MAIKKFKFGNLSEFFKSPPKIVIAAAVLIIIIAINMFIYF